MKKFCLALVDSNLFQSSILLLILMTAAAMGLETSPALADAHGDFFYFFAYFAQGVFLLEIIARLIAAPTVREFFSKKWNSFDFIIVALSFVPMIGSMALIARLLRILRVLRVFSVSGRLRRFMDSVAVTIDETFYAAVILLILGYIYAIGGYYLFSNLDPTHWGSFGRSCLSIFYLLLFQSVPAYVEPHVREFPIAVLFFVAFYMTFIGLFIGYLQAAINQSVTSDD